MNTDARLEAALTRLLPDLQAIAGYIISPEYTRDDLVQVMSEKIIERAQKDPTFLDQKDSYILTFATWRGKVAAGYGYTYNKYMGEEQVIATEDGEESSSFDYIPGSDPSPEEITVQREEMAMLVARMKGFNRHDVQIVSMLYVGYTRAEIARELGITKSAITQRISKIVQRIAV